MYDFEQCGHIFVGNQRNLSLLFVKPLLKEQNVCSESTTSIVLKRRNDSSSFTIFKIKILVRNLQVDLNITDRYGSENIEVMRPPRFKEVFSLINIICLLVFLFGSFLITSYAIHSWNQYTKGNSLQIERILTDMPMLSGDRSDTDRLHDSQQKRPERRIAM